MYPGLQAKIRPHQPAFIMATSGETVTYAELQARSNLAPPGGARRARWDLHIGSGSPGTGSSQTHPWREVDSNFRFRAAGLRC